LGERIDRGFKAIADDISDLRNDMATKEDVRTIVNEEMGPIRSELRLIRDELDDLSAKFANVSGFQKEIDHALERIAAIEKQLRNDKRIAA
jgi:septal ring factor EnvC (AmiA/AmiB activator)